MNTVLVIVLILLLLGALPVWSHSRRWGYGGTGVIGFILLLVIVAWLLGYL
ncbi:MAG: DUF3309 family protein [Bacteroidota bacterium]